MYQPKAKYWIFAIACIVLISLAGLFYTNSPGFVVKNNTARQTMQQILEADGAYVSYGNSPRSDAPFKDVFSYVIIMDKISFNIHKYKEAYPGDGVWIYGNKPGEEQIYIFTHRIPPSSIKELQQYIN